MSKAYTAPASVQQRNRISRMTLEQAENEWQRAYAARGVPSECGRYTSYPIEPTPCMRMLGDHIDSLREAAALAAPAMSLSHLDMY